MDKKMMELFRLGFTNEEIAEKIKSDINYINDMRLSLTLSKQKSTQRALTIRQMTKQGATTKEIATVVGTTQQSIIASQSVLNIGYKTRKIKYIENNLKTESLTTKANRNEMIERLLKTGKTQKEIAEILGVQPKSTYPIIYKMGITKESINNYFSTI